MASITNEFYDFKPVDPGKIEKPEPGNKRLFLDGNDMLLKLKHADDSIRSVGPQGIRLTFQVR